MQPKLRDKKMYLYSVFLGFLTVYVWVSGERACPYGEE